MKKYKPIKKTKKNHVLYKKKIFFVSFKITDFTNEIPQNRINIKPPSPCHHIVYNNKLNNLNYNGHKHV